MDHPDDVVGRAAPERQPRVRAAQYLAHDVLRRVVGVVGVLDDKDAEGILAELEPHLAEVVVTRSGSHRALEPDELAEVARDVFGEDRVHVAERLDNAIERAVELAERDESLGAGVLVTGSITLVAEARTLFGR